MGTDQGPPADRLRTWVQSGRRVNRCFNVCATGNFIYYNDYTHHYEIMWASGGHGGVTDLPYLDHIPWGYQRCGELYFRKKNISSDIADA